MSIETQLIAAKHHLDDSYAAVSTSGGTLPQIQSLENLPDAIDSISDPVIPTDFCVSRYNVDSQGAATFTTYYFFPNDFFSNITTIKDYGLSYAFYRIKFKEVNFDNLTYIGKSGCDRAFIDNTTIKKATFSSLQNINNEYSCREMFKNCIYLDSVSFPNLTTINGGNNYNYIYNMCTNMFSGCTALKNVDFSNLTTIGGLYSGYVCSEMFKDCTALESISFPSLTTIEHDGCYGMFYGCTSLKSIGFPSLTTIEHDGCVIMFRDCTALESISFPNLTTINGGECCWMMFYDCISLESASFPNLITISGSNNGCYCMFAGCTSLESISFPNLTTIGGIGACQHMFYGCTSLESISFPSLITINNSDAFYDMFNGCTSLTEIHFRSDAQSTIENLATYSSQFGATNATIYFDL